MATMFGRFEIQSEISKSDTAHIYKALDSETNQVVALKTQSLAPLGERAQQFVEALTAESEMALALAGQNIAQVFGAGEIDGQYCATMEYIEGNSIATMMGRHETFSIWDLLDITRQVGAALEQAALVGVVHSSLEPEKILVQWDGLVKVLGFGISKMSLIKAEAGEGLTRLMPYCSPEQIRGEAMDLRSNQFTLGAILYEMVTGRKAFDADDPVVLVNQIENEQPPEPSKINAKVKPALSALIMRALAKDPGERYATARELVEDLENCKEAGKETQPEVKKPAGTTHKINAAARAQAASKFISSEGSAGGAGARAAAGAGAGKSGLTSAGARAAGGAGALSGGSSAGPTVASSQPKAAAAKAGAGAFAIPNPFAAEELTADLGGQSGAACGDNSGARMIEEVPATEVGNAAPARELKSSLRGNAAAGAGSNAAGGKAPGAFLSSSSSLSSLSSATTERESETISSGIAVDPMMSGVAATPSGRSFSDLDELPPLKEPVFAAPRKAEAEVEEAQLPPLVAHKSAAKKGAKEKEEKPRIQPRELAKKAAREVVTIPPRLLLFSILGAIAVILVVAIALYVHVRSEDDGITVAPRAVKTAPAASTPPAAPAEKPVPQVIAPPTEPTPDLTVRQVAKRAAKAPRPVAPAPAPVVVTGEAFIDSTPQGVQFQLDGKSDPAWLTPFNLTGLSAGKHIVSANKAGYTTEIRSVEVVAGAKSSLVLHLSPVNALVAVSSNPAGAEITLDGHPTGRVTPSQFAVEKGTHTVLVKKQGFLDESTSADLGPGQNFQYAPQLKALGNAEAIRTVGRFNRLFGNSSNDSTAGMGTISIHTKPKGAQVVINQRILDKMSPVDAMMGPGTYIVDITLTGFKAIHKVVNVEKGNKVAIDEILERE